MKYPIYKDANGLFIVDLLMDNEFKLKMVLDTGATNTTIDSNALYFNDYDLKDSIGSVLIPNSAGIYVSDMFNFFSIFSVAFICGSGIHSPFILTCFIS